MDELRHMYRGPIPPMAWPWKAWPAMELHKALAFIERHAAEREFLIFPDPHQAQLQAFAERVMRAHARAVMRWRVAS